MNDVLELCDYIIKYYNDIGIRITQLKLQKLLYFIQSNFLIELGIDSPCFEDDIIALPYGPVVKRVLDKYKEMGKDYLILKKETNNIKNQEYVNEVLDYFKNFSASALVDITHKQTPWREAYSKGVGTVITKESIIKFFDLVSRLNNEKK